MGRRPEACRPNGAGPQKRVLSQRLERRPSHAWPILRPAVPSRTSSPEEGSKMETQRLLKDLIEAAETILIYESIEVTPEERRAALTRLRECVRLARHQGGF